MSALRHPARDAVAVRGVHSQCLVLLNSCHGSLALLIMQQPACYVRPLRPLVQQTKRLPAILLCLSPRSCWLYSTSSAMTPMSIAPLLREAAELKIEEFTQLKQGFSTRYGIGNPRPIGITLRERVATLARNIQKVDSHLEDDDDLTIIARFVEQSENDECISEDKLLQFEEQLLHKLEKQMNRYEATSFHLNLMREAMFVSEASATPLSTQSDFMASDDDFEVVEKGLEELLEKFESDTFTAKDVDTDALEVYLTNLMRNNGSLDELDTLRLCMRGYGNNLLEGDSEIEEDELEWCIIDLLKNDLISSEKRRALEGYIQNSIALKELLGALNMRSFRHWNWKHADKGLPVTARQDAEGQYHMFIEEDVVDMLFLHCTAVGWAQKLKECLVDYGRCSPLVDRRHISPDEQKERDFFLAMMKFESPAGRCNNNCQVYAQPMQPPPPQDMGYEHGVYVLPGRVTQNKGKKISHKQQHLLVMPPPPPPPPPPHVFIPPPPPPQPSHFSPGYLMPLRSLEEERDRVYNREFFMSRLPTQDGCRPKTVPTRNVETNLIKTLFAEIKLGKAFDSQHGCSVFNFHSLGSALPHQTVLVILKFLGVPEMLVDFFGRFFGAKLNLGRSVRGTPDRILTRSCGVPERHGLELLFTEAAMFFAELAVSKKTGLHLYRLGPKCYYVGTEEQRNKAKQELSDFSRHTKIEYEDVTTGPEQLNIGFLEMTADTIAINNSKVEAYAHCIKQQLSAQATIYGWVRTWNGTIGTYASHLFGPLIGLFGKSHQEAVKHAYKRVFDILFDGSNLTDHLKWMLRTRADFARICPPLTLEAMIYLPQTFGGLGVKNPFIAINLASSITSDPHPIIQEYLDVETKYYEAALKNWSALKPEHISKKLSSIFQHNDQAIAASLGKDCPLGTFFTKNDLTKHREYALFPFLTPTLLHDVPHEVIDGPTPTPYLVGLYRALLAEPSDNLIASERVSLAVREDGPQKYWGQLSYQDKWVLQMYGDECFERYGTLEMWVKDCIPMYCMTVVRGDIWDGNDDDTSSYICTDN